MVLKLLLGREKPKLENGGEPDSELLGKSLLAPVVETPVRLLPEEVPLMELEVELSS